MLLGDYRTYFRSLQAEKKVIQSVAMRVEAGLYLGNMPGVREHRCPPGEKKEKGDKRREYIKPATKRQRKIEKNSGKGAR